MLSSQPSEREVKFAKALVSPDKKVRDATFQTLKGFLAKNDDSIDELVHQKEGQKMWKALYYSLWLADKYPVQLELAQNLVDVLDTMSSRTAQVSYLSAGFRIIMREWPFLDQYRVNKFYTLLRLMLRKVFALAAKSNWSEDFVTELLDMVQNDILALRPNGPRLHFGDIYLPELYAVTQGQLTSEELLLALRPFFHALLTQDDANYRQRVHKGVFQAFIDTYARENKEGTVFKGAKTTAVQRHLFDLASEPSTPDNLRSGLYALHKLFALKTGKMSVEDGDEDEPEEEKDEVPELVAVEVPEKKKRKPRTREVAPVEEPSTPRELRSARKKRRDAEESGAEETGTEASEAEEKSSRPRRVARKLL